jgi:hypothetical protein
LLEAKKEKKVATSQWVGVRLGIDEIIVEFERFCANLKRELVSAYVHSGLGDVWIHVQQLIACKGEKKMNKQGFFF